MKINNWKSDEGNNPVRPKKTSSITNYLCPDLKNVELGVISDEEAFVPYCDRNCSSAEISANLPSSEQFIPHNGSAVVDCGFSLHLPLGYRCRVESLLPSLFVSMVDAPRFKLNVFNSGDPVVLMHMQKIAKMSVEPIHLFELIVKERNE